MNRILFVSVNDFDLHLRLHQSRITIEFVSIFICIVFFFYSFLVDFLLSLVNRTPTFDLKGLNPGNEYEIVLSAVNKKGRSPPFSLSAYTLKVPEKHTDLAVTVTTALMQRREILMMLAGSVVGIIVIALLITIVAKVRGSRGLDSKPMTSSLPPMPHNMDGMDHHQQNRQHQQESPDSSDKNPDIIPHTTLEEWQEANKQIYGSMHYRIPTLQQPQTAAAPAYNPSANGMIIYSGATLGRPHMNNNFKRIDSNGICAQQVNFYSHSSPKSIHENFHDLRFPLVCYHSSVAADFFHHICLCFSSFKLTRLMIFLRNGSGMILIHRQLILLMLCRNQIFHAQFAFNFIDNLCENSIFFRMPAFSLRTFVTDSSSIWRLHRYNTRNIIFNNSSIIIRSIHSRVLWLEVVREISKIH